MLEGEPGWALAPGFFPILQLWTHTLTAPPYFLPYWYFVFKSCVPTCVLWGITYAGIADIGTTHMKATFTGPGM